MKNKVLLIVASAIFSVSPILAKVGGVSVDELSNKEKFKEFEQVNKKVVENFMASRGYSNKVGKQEILHYNKKAVGRVYHLKPSGYVVATLNKNDVPIKAYSFKGSFDNLPEEYKEFLSARLYEYSELIEEAEKTQVIDSDNKKVWEYFENYTENSPKPIVESSVVNMNKDTERPPELPKKNQRSFTPNKYNKVLLDTAWNQSSPYNSSTHEVMDASGQLIHAPTGCAPTAWAQIMKFHEWPINSRGTTDTYEWYNWWTNATEWIPARTLNNTYDWANMEAQGSSEIAPLMADIGYALKADWNITGGTSAIGYDTYARSSIAEHFGYSIYMSEVNYMNFISRNEYIAYKNAVINNIDHLRPLFASYVNGYQNYGHAVVIDGYRNINVNGGENFEAHINLGWGGDVPSVNDGDWYFITYNSSGSLMGFPAIEPVTYIKSVGGIEPCRNAMLNCHANFAGNGKEGLTLTNGWNLVSLKGNTNDVEYLDFIYAISVHTYDYASDTWYQDENISQIEINRGIWINHNGTREYVLPGGQNIAVELTPDKLHQVYNTVGFITNDWALLGTGVNILKSSVDTYFKDCLIFNNNQWLTCPNTIEAGSGFWVQKK